MDYWVTAALFGVLFLGVADNQMIFALLPLLGSSLHKSVEITGLLVVVYSLAAALASFLVGAFSDLYGRRRFLLFSVLLFAAASWYASATHTFAHLLSARLLTGLAAGMISTCSITFAGDWFNYSVRGKAIGLISAAYFAAPIVGVPLAGAIADRYGWSRVFVFFAALASVLAVASVALPNDPVVFKPPPDKLHHSLRSYSSFLKRRDLGAALCIAFLVSAGLVGFINYIGQWLHDVFGISTGGITLVFMVGGIASIAGAPLGGILSDRWGKRSVSIASNILLAVAILLVPFLRWRAGLLVLFGATGFAAALRQGPLTALMTEMVPARQRGSFIALRNISSQLGIGAVALTGGVLYQSQGYAAVTTLCACMTALVAVLLTTHIAEPAPAGEQA